MRDERRPEAVARLGLRVRIAMILEIFEQGRYTHMLPDVLERGGSECFVSCGS